MQSTTTNPIRWTITDLVIFEGDRRDREAKLKLYSVRGVLEYWIVNVQEQVVKVYRRENGILKLAATLYRQDELTSPILPGFSSLISKFF